MSALPARPLSLSRRWYVFVLVCWGLVLLCVVLGSVLANHFMTQTKEKATKQTRKKNNLAVAYLFLFSLA